MNRFLYFIVLSVSISFLFSDYKGVSGKEPFSFQKKRDKGIIKGGNNQNLKIVVVESEHAPCLIKSAQKNKITSVPVEKETIMAGLSCGEPSLLGWEILSSGADDFITISDDSIPSVMRFLSKNSPYIEAGESSVAGLVGLIEIMKNQKVAKNIGLGSDSIVLLFGTEGATDPEIYNSIINT